VATSKDGTRQSGKGGDFISRPNLFGRGSAHSMPALADHSNCGLAIDAVLRAGNAIMLGGTRDGGALCITVLEGDTRHRTYCSNYNELEDALAQLREFFE